MQEGNFNGIDRLGSRLSIEIDCTVRWLAKGVFICKHGVEFPAERLQDSEDWTWVENAHRKIKGGQHGGSITASTHRDEDRR